MILGDYLFAEIIKQKWGKQILRPVGFPIFLSTITIILLVRANVSA